VSADLVAVARRWLQAGFSVIPVSNNKRAYLTWADNQVRPYAIDEAERVFSDPRAQRIAIVCGYGGVMCFDFDADKNNVAAEPVNLEDDFWTPWRDTADGLGVEPVTQRTPSGGIHAVAVCPTPIGNEKLARVPGTPDDKGKARTHTTIETRGKGGYFLLYDLDLDPNSLPSVTDEQFVALLEAAMSLDRINDAEPAARQAAQAKRGTGAKANATRKGLVGWFNEHHTVQEVLQRNGYRLVHNKYLAPSSSSGNAGVVIFKDDAGMELCFSHHSDALGDGHAHDAFDTMKLLEFHDNFEAALGGVKQLHDRNRFTFAKAAPQTTRAKSSMFEEALRRGAFTFDYHWREKTCQLVIEAADVAEMALIQRELPQLEQAEEGLLLLLDGEAACDVVREHLAILRGNALAHAKKVLRKMSESLPSGSPREDNVSLTPNRGNPVTDATTIWGHPLTPNADLTPKDADLVSNPEKVDTKSANASNAVLDAPSKTKLRKRSDLVSNDDTKYSSPSPSQKHDLVSNAQAIPTRARTTTIQRWGDRERPNPVQWLVHHLIQDNADNLIAGEPGVGKSWISGDLAVAIATGSSFLDRPTVQGPVVVINFDDPSESLPRMFAEFSARGREYEFHELPLFYWQPDESKPYPPEGLITPDVFEFLLEQVALIKPRLIIVDAYSSAFPGLDGNKGNDVIRAFEALRQLRIAAGKPCSLVLVDHTPKATLQDSKRRGVSGSQQKHAKTRTVHIVRHVDPGDVNGDDVLEWEVFKANAAPRQESFGIDREIDSMLNTAKLSTRPLPQRGAGAKNDRAAKAAITVLAANAGRTFTRQDLLKEVVVMANVSMETARRGLRSNEFLDHPQLRTVELGGRGSPTGYAFEPERAARVSLYEQLRAVAFGPDAEQTMRHAKTIREAITLADNGDDDAKDRVDAYLARDEVRAWLAQIAREQTEKEEKE